MAFSLKISNHEISHLIAYRGLKWSRNDIDGSNAGRNLNGDMIRDYVSTKDKLEITCRPMTSEELSSLLAIIEPSQANQGQFNVQFGSPRGSMVSMTMYLSSVPASYLINKGDSALWGGVSIHLIEV